MSRSINRVELLGHLGKDAEVKYTPNGVQFASFSIATSRRFKKQGSEEWQEVTDWHRCILWRCENVFNFLKKGKQLYITGRLQTRSYEHEGVTRYVTEITCEELILLGGGGGAGGERSSGNSGGRPAANATPEYGEHGVSEDDVPF
jgi:single-strand DNA-binding protein